LTDSAPADARRRSAFGEGRFRRYFPSSCFSTLGTWITRFLLGWSAWEVTHSALWVGVVTGLMLLPTFVLSPIFGIVSDRINPRNGLLVTCSLQALVAAVAGWASALGLLSLPWLVWLATAVGAVTSAHTPIRLALIPRLVPRQALPSAIGTSAIIFNTSRILGPAAGGWLVAHASVAAAFCVSAVLFAVAVPILLSVRDIERWTQRGKTTLFAQLRAGLGYVRNHRGIRLVLALTLVNGLLGRTVLELLPALSGQLLDGDPRTLATLTALAGLGSIAGGLIVSRQSGNESRLLNMVIICLVSAALVLLPVPWLASLWALAAMVMYLSMSTTMIGTGSQALVQLLVDEDFRGRVLSLWTVLAMGAPALGAFLMGALADWLGFTRVLPGFAVAAGLAILLLYRRREWLLQKGA